MKITRIVIVFLVACSVTLVYSTASKADDNEKQKCLIRCQNEKVACYERGGNASPCNETDKQCRDACLRNY